MFELFKELKKSKNKSYYAILFVIIGLGLWLLDCLLMPLLYNLQFDAVYINCYFLTIFTTNGEIGGILINHLNCFAFVTLILSVLAFKDVRSDKEDNEISNNKLELSNLILVSILFTATLCDFITSFIFIKETLILHTIFTVSAINHVSSTVDYFVQITPFVVIGEILYIIIKTFKTLRPVEIVYVDEEGNQIGDNN